MCFSNLPIEFDDDGNPYLAAEADDVDRPPASDAEPESTCECTEVIEDVALDDADPEAFYESIVETMPSDVREHLADSDKRSGRVAEYDRPRTGPTD